MQLHEGYLSVSDRLEQKRITAMLVAIGFLLALYTFSPFRMLALEYYPGFLMRTFISYLGQAVIFSSVLLFLLYKRWVTLDHHFYWCAGLVALFGGYELLTQGFGFAEIKRNIIYSKVIQGLVVATCVYVLWRGVYRRDPRVAEKALFWLFWMFAGLNLLLACMIILFPESGKNYQLLQNNRSSLEMFCLSLALYLTCEHKERNYNFIFFAFFFVLVAACVYSTRSVILGLTVVTFSVGVFDARMKPLLRLGFIGLAVLGAYVLLSPGKYLPDITLKSYLREINAQRLLEAGESNGVFARKRALDEARPIQLHDKWSRQVVSELGYEITGTKIAKLPLNTISTISRVGNAIGSARAFAKEPLGKGIRKARERQVLHHGNHALLMVLIEAYGVFLIIYALAFLIFGAPIVPLVAWMPIAIASLFFANFSWAIFLPFVMYSRRSAVRTETSKGEMVCALFVPRLKAHSS